MARQKEPTWVTENKPFPKALRELMQETDTTQPMLAGSIGVTRQTISLYCTGQSTPDIEVFTKIAEYFDVSFDYLLGKFEAKKRENINIQERTGLSDEAIKNLERLNNIISSSETEQISLVDESGLIDDSERILKAINFILDDSHMGMQFLLNIGRYLFIDYGSEHHSKVNVIEDFITLVDKKTNRKQGFPVSIIKKSLLLGITSQLEEWEKDIMTNKEK